MDYRVKVSKTALKQIGKLPQEAQRRILDALDELDGTETPRETGKALQGALKGFWRYRVGNYRIVCQIIDQELVVLVVKVAHRRDVYR